MDTRLRTDLQSILQNFPTPVERSAQIDALKIGKSPEEQAEMDAYASAFVDCYQEGVSGLIPAQCLGEIANGVELLRDYANKHRPEVDQPADLWAAELAKFEAYYLRFRPRIIPSDLADYDAEYAAIRDFRLRESEPLMPTIDAYSTIASGGLSLALGGYNALSTESDITWNLAMPINPLYGFRLVSTVRDPLTPSEQKTISRLRFTGDALATTASLLPKGKEAPLSEPTEAGEADYTSPPGVPGELPTGTLRYYNNSIEGLISADVRAGIALRRLEDQTSFLGPQVVSNPVNAAVDSLKLVLLSQDRGEFERKEKRTETLASGEDGDECTTASAEEIDGFRQLNPKHADLSDEEIMRLICAAEGPVAGGNPALPAPKQAFDSAISGRLAAGYLNTALHRNAMLLEMNSNVALAGGLILVATQPLLNQIHPGADSGQIGTDYALEAVALAGAAVSYEKPDLRFAMGMANDQLAGAFFYPEFYLRLGEHASGDDRPNPNFPQVFFVGGLVLDGLNQYGTGVEHGAMVMKAARATNTSDRLRYLAPAAAGLTSHIIRRVRHYRLTDPDSVSIEGLSGSEVSELQAPYADNENSSLASNAHWISAGLYGAGIGAAVVYEVLKGSSGSGSTAFLSGSNDTFAWDLRLAPAGLVLGGTF
ncbi:MAG: hypothetical protein Q7T11_04330 [Deltaproteobacteria bacterium]|nr:hypothetical protein [Deltaproteobacteria bacterium]